MPETSGHAGTLGFCMGGRLAYKVAVAADPDAVVSYYGSGIGAELGGADQVRAPILFQFGEADQYLTLDEANSIRSTFASRPNTEVHVHSGAGHAFDNPSPMFHHAQASRDAWPQTAGFLRRYLPA